MAKKNGRRKREKAFVYESSTTAGAGLIISNEFFDTLSRRHGTEVDVERFQSTLPFLGFAKVDICRDLTAAAILEVCRSFARRHVHKEGVAIFVAIFSHGGKGVVYGSDDQPVQTAEILSCFNGINAPHLVGKVKLIMLNACRGIESEPGVLVADSRQASTPQTLPASSDFFTAYSSTINTVSWRSEQRGSVFGEQVSKALDEKAWDTDLATIFAAASEAVSKVEGANGARQQPDFHTTLRGKFYFEPTDSCESFLQSIEFVAEYNYEEMLRHLARYVLPQSTWKPASAGGAPIWKPFIKKQFRKLPRDQRPKPASVMKHWIRHKRDVLCFPKCEDLSPFIPLYLAHRLKINLSDKSLRSLHDRNGIYFELQHHIQLEGNLITKVLADWTEELSEALEQDESESDSSESESTEEED